MIHSLAGGVIKNLKVADFAKLEYLEGDNKGQTGWYISPFFLLEEGNTVLVPFQESKIKAKVLKIEKDVTEQVSPIPFHHAKEILEIIE